MLSQAGLGREKYAGDEACNYRTFTQLRQYCEPVWPSGKALGWYAAGPRFVSSCDFVPQNLLNIKMALIAAHLNAGIILVVTV